MTELTAQMREVFLNRFDLSLYRRILKIQKRHIVGQIIFEFEAKSDKIAAFRYIERDQIANLAALQSLIDNN